MNRAVSFEYMNRQLVWNEFSVINSPFSVSSCFFVLFPHCFVFLGTCFMRGKFCRIHNSIYLNNLLFPGIFVGFCRRCCCCFFLFLIQHPSKTFSSHFRKTNHQSLQKMILLAPFVRPHQQFHFLLSLVNTGMVLFTPFPHFRRSCTLLLSSNNRCSSPVMLPYFCKNPW